MRFVVALYLILAGSIFRSQVCERYDRKLFHLLPEYVPDEINCIDSLGRRQGWWINYKVGYNPKRIPDYLDSGNYIDRYTFGKYRDGRKVGKWKEVANVHQIFISKTDSFVYTGDTIRILTDEIFTQSSIEYIKDSTISNFVTYRPEQDTIRITCSKQKGCVMYFRNRIFKRFPYSDFKPNYLNAWTQVEFSPAYREK